MPRAYQTLSGWGRRFTASSVTLIEKIKMTEHTFMMITAIIIGAAAGLGAIGIRAMILEVSNLSFPGDGSLLENIRVSPWFIVLLAPLIGGILTGPLIHFIAPEAKGSGVPEVIQSVLIEGGRIRPRVAIVKSIASVITIGTGGSVGREGPIIQIGASIGSTIGQLFQVSGIRIKTLVGCGAAAGIAAAFNAPIAGALFAVEIILMDFAVAQFSPIVISSVTATVISRYFEEDFAAFMIPSYQLNNPVELGFYVIMGLLCGVISFLFIKSLFYSEDLIQSYIRLPGYLKPALGGLAVGGIALIYPEIMGVGYDSINNALHGDVIWKTALALVFIKIIATSCTLGTGGSGGIFAPSLFIGAMVGFCFGMVVEILFPGIPAPPGAYALVAMGGIVAGTTRAPITAIIIIFEITGSYNVILPLMLTCITSAILSSKFSRESIYTMRLVLRNIRFVEGADINPMRSIHVRDVYSERVESISEDTNFGDVVQQLFSRESPYLVVLDHQKNLLGTIFLNNIRSSYFEWSELQDLIIAKDIVFDDFRPVILTDDCQEALDRMIESKLPGLPVVKDIDSKEVIGMLWQKDILDTYHEEMSRKTIATTLLDKIHVRHAHQEVRFMQGRSIAEVPVPESFWGKSIIHLHIRSKYEVEILSIHSQKESKGALDVFPDPNRIFTDRDEYMTIAGKIERINQLKNIR